MALISERTSGTPPGNAIENCSSGLAIQSSRDLRRQQKQNFSAPPSSNAQTQTTLQLATAKSSAFRAQSVRGPRAFAFDFAPRRAAPQREGHGPELRIHWQCEDVRPGPAGGCKSELLALLVLRSGAVLLRGLAEISEIEELCLHPRGLLPPLGLLLPPSPHVPVPAGEFFRVRGSASSASINGGSAAVREGSVAMNRGIATKNRGIVAINRGIAAINRGVAAINRGSVPINRGITPINGGNLGSKLVEPRRAVLCLLLQNLHEQRRSEEAEWRRKREGGQVG